MSETVLYTTTIRELLEIPTRMPLRAKSPNSDGVQMLNGVTSKALFEGFSIEDASMCDAALAGLWLRFDALDPAHQLINEIDTGTGELWHGILHRREGDYPNARYWMHQAGNHPIYNYLAQGAGAILAEMESLNAEQLASQIKEWDPIYFVKLCERAVEAGGDLADFCSQVQDLEWKILFHFCFQSAVGEF